MRVVTRAFLAAAVLMAVCHTSSVASAQPAGDVREARARFLAGAAAVEAGRWADAVENFERSYELSGAPSALYNLALALRALGRYVAARDRFDDLLRVDDVGGEIRQSARDLRAEVARRIATVHVEGLPRRGEVDVRLDGRPVTDPGTRPLEVATDPGDHTLVAEREAHQPFVWEGRLDDGQQEYLQVRWIPIRSAGSAPFDPIEAPPERRSIASRPAFWIVLGVVLAGAAVTLGVLLGGGDRVQPLSDMPVDIQ